MSFQVFNTELANPSGSAGQFLAGTFVVFVAGVRGFGFLMYSKSYFFPFALC